jgi:hypothetical protein
MIRKIAVFLLGLVVSACATPLTVNSDYDTAADFASLNTYDWLPAAGNAAGDELLIKKIRNAVDSQLQEKGRTLVSDNPDFLIGMELSGRTTYGGSVAVGMSVGIPVGRSGRISVGGGKSTPREKTEGTLVLTFVDAMTKALVWRATATEAVNPAASPDAKLQKINAVVSAMLAQFPPKN